MMHSELNEAIQIAKNVLGDTYDKLSPIRKAVMVDMAYNLGQLNLQKFKKFKEALEKNDYEKAAQEIQNSLYATQVKSRAVRNALMIKDGKVYKK